jgi:hypothetical protein
MFSRSADEAMAGWIALNGLVFERLDEASALIGKET